MEEKDTSSWRDGPLVSACTQPSRPLGSRAVSAGGPVGSDPEDPSPGARPALLGTSRPGRGRGRKRHCWGEHCRLSTLTPPWSQGPAGQPPNAMQPGCQPSSPHAAQRRGARATFGVGVGLGHSTQAGPPPRPPRVCRSLAQATPEEHLLCAALLPDQGAASAPADTQGPSPTLWPCTVPARSLGFLSVTWGDSLLLGWGVRHLLSPTAPPSQDSSPVCTTAASPSPPEPFPEADSLLFEKQGFLTPSLAALNLLTNLPRFTRSVQGGRRR